MNNLAHNLLLDARVKHQDLKSAEDIMDQTRQAGKTYVVSFNTLIKSSPPTRTARKGNAC